MVGNLAIENMRKSLGTFLLNNSATTKLTKEFIKTKMLKATGIFLIKHKMHKMFCKVRLPTIMFGLPEFMP